MKEKEVKEEEDENAVKEKEEEKQKVKEKQGVKGVKEEKEKEEVKEKKRVKGVTEKEGEAVGGLRCSCSRVMGWEGPPPSLPPTTLLISHQSLQDMYCTYLFIYFSHPVCHPQASSLVIATFFGKQIKIDFISLY